MANFIVKIPCAGYAKGDIAVMDPAEAAAYGAEYLEEVINDITAEQNDEAENDSNENKAEEPGAAKEEKPKKKSK
jgi:hypothetical protein